MTGSPSLVPQQHLEAALQNLRYFWSRIAMVAAIIIPLGGVFWAGFGPPWPMRTGVAVFSSLLSIMMLAYAFNVWSNLSKDALRRRMIIAGLVSIVSYMIYAFLSASFIYNFPFGESIIAGFRLTALAQHFLSQNPGLSTYELLKVFALDVSSVWEPWTIAVVKISILTSWLFLSVGLSAFIAALILSFPASAYRRTAVDGTSVQLKELNQIIDRVEREPEKVKPAWDLARVKLELYFDRNLSQINYIFWLSVLVMAVGFAFILYGIKGAFASSQSNAVPPALISGLAGVITEFIGATFLFLYRSTIQQAASYTQTLERINSVGMAMQILDSISEKSRELQDQTKAEIVKVLLTYPTAGIDNRTSALKKGADSG